MAGLDLSGSFAPATGTSLTIASGVVTVAQMKHVIAAETGTADDLDTITVDSTIGSGYQGIVILRADTGDTITLKHGTGNIALPGSIDVSLSGQAVLMLVYNGTNWVPTYATESASVVLLSGQATADAATVAISGWSNLIASPSEFELVVTGLETDRAATYIDSVLVTFNADATAANYNSSYLEGSADTVSSADVPGTAAGVFCINITTAATSDAGSFGILRLYIRRPLSTDDYKHVEFSGGISSQTNNEYAQVTGVGVWESSAAITSITLTPVNGTTFLIGDAGEPTALDWVLKAHR